MNNYMQSRFYPVFINDSQAGHTYIDLLENDIRIDFYECFGTDRNKTAEIGN